MDCVKGKRLLILGGTNASYDLVRTAREMGVYTIVTDDCPDRVSKRIADEHALVSTTDMDGLLSLIREKHIDGVFSGPSEFNLQNVIRVCELAGLPCYTTQDVWNKTANKAMFKQYCREYGVDCTPEYDITLDTPMSELEKIEYPLIVKPVDGSSSIGVTVCWKAADVRGALEKAYAASTSKKIIAEKFIENGGRVFNIRYFMRDGEAFPYFLTDTYVAAHDHLFAGYTHSPSEFAEQYLQTMDQNVRRMLKGMGIRNGAVFIQSLPKDGKFYCHEMGYRLSGGMYFKMTDPLANLNDMKLMIRLALGADNITDDETAAIDLTCKGKIGCQLMLPLNAGTIERIEGLDAVRAHASVVDVLQYYREGDTVEPCRIGTLGQLLARVTFIVDSVAEEHAILRYLQDTVRAYDTDGRQMNTLPLDITRLRKDGSTVQGKRLLILGGTSASYDLVRNAKAMGIYTIVTDDCAERVSKKIADDTAMVSTTDMDGLLSLIREKRVDGVFCGPSEFNLRNVIRVCELAGLPCYTTMDIWDRCANKDVFKQYCRQFGVDCTPEYDVTLDTPMSELEKIEYPIIIKPVDGSSSAGISVCRSAADVHDALVKAYAASKSKKIIAEKYIENGGELFSVRYFLRDGEAYPYFLMDTYVADPIHRTSLISGYTHAPSKYADYYLKHMDADVRRMLKGMGLKNGTAFIQSLPYQGKIYFHEMGYRLSGGMLFKLTEPLANVNDMQMMLRLAVGGESVTSEEAANFDIRCKGKIGGQLMLPLDVGTIGKVEGVDAIREHPAVVDYIQYYRVGDTIEQRNIGTLGQHFGRITFIVDSAEEEQALITQFQATVRVYDVDGNRMNNLQFDIARF